MSESRRVVVTGMGALNALAAGPKPFWRGLLANKSGIRTLPRFQAAALPATTGGEVDHPASDRMDRDQAIARLTMEQALSQAGRATARTGFFWSTGLDTYQIDSQGFAHRSAGHCFNRLARPFGGPKRFLAAACASSAQAIGEAFHYLRDGRGEAVLAGGSSVMLTPFYVFGFAGLRAIALDEPGQDPAQVCRPFDRRRRGFALGDGAGALLLEPLHVARARGATPLAEVLGFAMTQDAHDLNSPPEDGAGALQCMRQALRDGGLEPGQIDAVNAHGTGTVLGDPAEAAAMRGLLGAGWERVPVSGSKGAIGHTMAAAGVLDAIVAIYSCRTGLVPPTVNLERPGEGCELDHVMVAPRQTDAHTLLSVSFGMGGQNAALVFRRLRE